MKNKVFIFVLLALLLVVSAAPLVYAQKTFKIRFNEFDDVIENSLFKWYGVDDDGKLDDTYKTPRMIIDMVVFFMIFAAMIFFSLKKWIGEKSKGALAMLTIGLGFGLSLALVTRTKYGSISVFFPVARNLLTLLLFIGLYKLCTATFLKEHKFWAVIIAIFLTRLMVGWWGIYTCDPATADCGASMFLKSAGGSGEISEWSGCQKLLTQAEKNLADAQVKMEEGNDFYDDKKYSEALKKYGEAEKLLNSANSKLERINKGKCLQNTPEIIKKAKELVKKVADYIKELVGKKKAAREKGGGEIEPEKGWKGMVEGAAKCKAYVEEVKRWNPKDWECIKTTAPKTCKKSVTATGYSLCGSGLYCAVGPCPGTGEEKDSSKENQNKLRACSTAAKLVAISKEGAEKAFKNEKCSKYCDCSSASLGKYKNLLNLC